jgi:hypothetical protein
MARITVNTLGDQPHIYLTMDTANVYDGTLSTTWVSTTNALDVTCLQDITITNSTGVFSWTDFCQLDMQKITTPADNSVETNIVLEDDRFFGTDPAAVNPTAVDLGVNGLSSQKQYVQFVVVMNGDLDGTAGKRWYQGFGYITSIAPTVNPEAPVWVSPMTIAVTGDFETGVVIT